MVDIASTDTTTNILRLVSKGNASHDRRMIQPVDATTAASIAAGVWYPSVLRGLVFRRAATVSRSAWLYPERSVHSEEVLAQQPVGRSYVCQYAVGSAMGSVAAWIRR